MPRDPKQWDGMRPRTYTNSLLACCVAALIVLCTLSISQPLRFDHERQRRETVVKQRLVQIRHAQKAYLRAHHRYCADWAALIREGYLTQPMQYIPYTDNKQFRMAATVITTTSGRAVPVMECGAYYTDYLDGMDRHQVISLMREAGESGNYPGLKIGDLIIPNDNAGNWE